MSEEAAQKPVHRGNRLVRQDETRPWVLMRLELEKQYSEFLTARRRAMQEAWRGGWGILRISREFGVSTMTVHGVVDGIPGGYRPKEQS